MPPLSCPCADTASEDRARQQAVQAMISSSHQGLSRVRCKLEDGKLELRGTVPTFYLKQLAQEIARKLKDIKRVVNHIEVNLPRAD